MTGWEFSTDVLERIFTREDLPGIGFITPDQLGDDEQIEVLVSGEVICPLFEGLGMSVARTSELWDRENAEKMNAVKLTTMQTVLHIITQLEAPFGMNPSAISIIRSLIETLEQGRHEGYKVFMKKLSPQFHSQRVSQKYLFAEPDMNVLTLSEKISINSVHAAEIVNALGLRYVWAKKISIDQTGIDNGKVDAFEVNAAIACLSLFTTLFNAFEAAWIPIVEDHVSMVTQATEEMQTVHEDFVATS